MQQIPPKDNEFELSVFGPGVGECLVVHLGMGKWIIVDSCLDKTGTGPVALEYLNSLGVDIESQVRGFSLTGRGGVYA